MAWYNPSWLYRLPVTVDNTANTTSALAWHQVSLSLTGAAYTSFHAHAKSDGSDIRVADSDGATGLWFVLEGIDTVSGVIYLLVKVPRVAPAATTTIYIYYGNAAAGVGGTYVNAVGPGTALTGPTDVYTQSDTTGFNGNSYAVLLKNQGGAHGGGAGLNGKILCFLMAGANSNGDRTNGSIAFMSSTDGGVTWGSKAVILAHNVTNMAEPRSLIELADGTILMAYSCDTFANSSAGKAKVWIARSTDGGSTWSNLSMTASNALAVPWTYNTDTGTCYGRFIEKTPGGDLYLAVYGKIVADSAQHAWLLECLSGNDPTNGSNWSVQGVIAFDNTNTWQEPCVMQTTDSSHYIAVLRNGVVGVAGDFSTCTSADSGVTWTTPTRMNLPGTVYNSIGGAVSPDMIKLVSGNYLFCWGVRYGTDYGSIGAVISTDNGVTWLDRAPWVMTTGYTSTLWDGGYPSAVQNANGTICVVAYRNNGVSIDICNIFRVIMTEDFVCNINNVYDTCDSFGAKWSAVGADATLSATHVHSGTNAIKFDDSTGTHNPVATLAAFSANPAAQNQKTAYSYWHYPTQIASNHWTAKIQDVTLNPRVLVATGTSPFNIKWFNGTTYQDTGVPAGINAWYKITARANIGPSSATGQILLNNVNVTTSLGQDASGTMPSNLLFQAGSTASTNATTVWIDDVYTHQYTANVPVVTAGTEQIFVPAGFAPVGGGLVGGSLVQGGLII